LSPLECDANNRTRTLCMKEEVIVVDGGKWCRSIGWSGFSGNGWSLMILVIVSILFSCVVGTCECDLDCVVKWLNVEQRRYEVVVLVWICLVWICFWRLKKSVSIVCCNGEHPPCVWKNV
jgi:hypothetical protein